MWGQASTVNIGGTGPPCSHEYFLAKKLDATVRTRQIDSVSGQTAAAGRGHRLPARWPLFVVRSHASQVRRHFTSCLYTVCCFVAIWATVGASCECA